MTDTTGKNVTVWLIEPRDPLVFRDGRPFGATPGARSHSLPFPFPSTVAGMVRERAGLDEQGIFRFNPRNYPPAQKKEAEEQLKQLRKLAIRGPLLLQIPQGQREITPADWMVPAPNDAVLLPLKEEEKERLTALSEQEQQPRRIGRLQPQSFPDKTFHDLKQHKQGLQLVALQRVGEQDDAGKPDNLAPHYWTWGSMQSWLCDPETFQEKQHSISLLGHKGPVRELRTHLQMNPYTRAGESGMLFDTSGMEFVLSDTRRGTLLGTARNLGLLVIVGDEKTATTFRPRSGLGGSGGERRIVHWQQSTCTVPACCDKIVERIAVDRACRVILLTPACFTEGYRPSWITEPREGVQPELQAIAIDRPQVVSGWDLEKGGPKATRRLAPAGTVLFLSLKASSNEAIKQWIEKIWLQCISDEEQDRTDGFGLAVLGTWSEGKQACERKEGQTI